MKLGGEPRKLAVLALLIAVAGWLYFSGDSSEQRSSAPPPARPAIATETAPRPAPSRRAVTAAPATRASASASTQEFRPSLKPLRPEDRPDPMSVDPLLRLDLLARLQQVTVAGGERSLFEFSQPPAPKVQVPKIIPKDAASAKPAAPVEVKDPPKPPPPPIPLKFYGYISSSGAGSRRAFFLEGEEIFVATEGELIRNRYKIVRIGVNSAVVEDTQHKHQQTLRLEEQAG